MTREESINKWIVPALKNTWNDKKCEEVLKALELEQELFINKPCVSEKACEHDKQMVLDNIRAKINALSNANPSYWHSGDMVDRDEVFEIIDKYKE